MKKHILVQLYFCSLLLLTHSLQSSTHWWNYDDDYSSSYDSIDYPALKRIIEQEMDRLFELYKQTAINRQYLIEVKEYAQREICSRIGSQCSTHSQAKKLVITLTQELAVETVVEWAAYIAQELLKNPPVNPAYLNYYEIINAVKQIIRSQAQLALRDGKRLTQLVQNLHNNVAVLVKQEIDYQITW